jgi:hypothetical protein
MNKPKRIRWAGHVERMWKIRNAYKIEKSEGKRPLGNLVTDGRIILKWILVK